MEEDTPKTQIIQNKYEPYSDDEFDHFNNPTDKYDEFVGFINQIKKWKKSPVQYIFVENPEACMGCKKDSAEYIILKCKTKYCTYCISQTFKREGMFKYRFKCKKCKENHYKICGIIVHFN